MTTTHELLYVSTKAAAPGSYGTPGRRIWPLADVAAATLGAGYCHANNPQQEAKMYGSVTAAMAQERVADLYRQAEHVRLARVARAARRRGGRRHLPSAFGPRSA